MKERSTIMNSEEVRALLNNNKTQKRFPIKKQPSIGWELFPYKNRWGHWVWSAHSDFEDLNWPGVKCPYGKPGDRLWVKETWKYNRDFEGGGIPRLGIYYEKGIEWKAIGPNEYNKDIKWKSPIHMPHWASRITLEVKDVRVERVRDISRWDIDAEGCPLRCESDDGIPEDQLEWFQDLWDLNNESRGFGWDRNPWVWVVEFERVKTDEKNLTGSFSERT